MGAVAQLEERHNGIVEVVGSNPIGSTIFRRGQCLKWKTNIIIKSPAAPLFDQ
jgi:hypothetical protein